MSNEIILETVRELLPDIEREIREQVAQELQAEYQGKFEQEIEGLTNFDEEQLRQELELQLRSDYEKQKEQLAQDVVKEFDESLQRGQLEQQLRFKIQEELEEQINEEMAKKSKSIKLQFKKRLETERQQLIKDFELEWKQKVDAEKKRLEREKSEIARLKSVENVKLKKLQDEHKKYSQVLKDQESKYQEITRSLQKQIQDLTQQLESALQDQLIQDRKKPEPQEQQQTSQHQDYFIELTKPIHQVYQHKHMTETEQSQQQSTEQQERKNIKQKPTKSPYQQQIEKGVKQMPEKKLEKQIEMQVEKEKQVEKENNTRKMNKIDSIIKEHSSPVVKYEQSMSYNSLFKENDLDNTKNKQMKLKRQNIVEMQEIDQKLQTKYLALQINIMNEFIVDYIEQSEYNQVKILLQELIECFNKWMISYQERIEFLKQVKQIANTSFRDTIPFIQTQLHKFHLIQNYHSDFLKRFSIKNQIMQNYTSQSKCKHLFEELSKLNLKSVNLSVWGCDFQELIMLDQWERDFLEREELKSQILCKIQSKLI